MAVHRSEMGGKRTPSPCLKSRISNLLQKESSSDVEFLVGSPPHRYLCHKTILAAGSEVFERMFYGELKQKSPVRVPDIGPKGFGVMLQYLYSDAVTLEETFDAFETAYSAKKYMVEGLFATCEDFLLDNLSLNPENVLSVHEESSFLGMKELRGRCRRYVSRHAKRVLRSESFPRTSRDTLEEVLRLDWMDIDSEKEIIEALWLWGEQRCLEQGTTCSAENIRGHTRELLKHVRFLAMTVEELASILEKCKLLDTGEELSLLWNHAMPGAKRPFSMPLGICSESKTRSIANSPKVQFPGQYCYDGKLTAFLIERSLTLTVITVTGSPISVIGAVIAFKPIPCYSSKDRWLEVEILATNSSTSVSSRVKSRFAAEGDVTATGGFTQLLMLEDYVEIGEDQVASLEVIIQGEGVRLMQCTEEALRYDLRKSSLFFRFKQSSGDIKGIMPVKELRII